MCQFETSWDNKKDYFEEIPSVITQLLEMEKDGLVVLSDRSIKVTEIGKAHVRNICMAFDLLSKRKRPDTELFSMTI